MFASRVITSAMAMPGPETGTEYYIGMHCPHSAWDTIIDTKDSWFMAKRKQDMKDSASL
jgi:hypothetical protein